MARKRIKRIHRSIRQRLGYSLKDTVDHILEDWEMRLSRVCKPCWELKYCPYGPLVEQLPLLPTTLREATSFNEYLVECLKNGTIGSVSSVSDDRREELQRIMDDDDLCLRIARHRLIAEQAMENAEKSSEPLERLESWLGGPLPPVHEYRCKYDPMDERPVDLAALPEPIRTQLDAICRDIRKSAATALETGTEDNRMPLDSVRKAWFLEQVNEFNPKEYPEEVPDIFLDGSCNVFGHICPVFFAAEAITETSEERRRGRYIPFHIKMRVVRRDNYTCQNCGAHLKDDEVEFDHIIPLSRGGSTEEHNLRLTCFGCNREKSASIDL